MKNQVAASFWEHDQKNPHLPLLLFFVKYISIDFFAKYFSFDFFVKYFSIEFSSNIFQSIFSSNIFQSNFRQIFFNRFFRQIFFNRFFRQIFFIRFFRVFILWRNVKKKTLNCHQIRLVTSILDWSYHIKQLLDKVESNMQKYWACEKRYWTRLCRVQYLSRSPIFFILDETASK